MKFWHWLGIILLLAGVAMWWSQSNADMNPKLPAQRTTTTPSN